MTEYSMWHSTSVSIIQSANHIYQLKVVLPVYFLYPAHRVSSSRPLNYRATQFVIVVVTQNVLTETSEIATPSLNVGYLMVHFCFHRVQSSRLFLTTSPLTNANTPWINICTGGENLPRWIHDPDWCLEMYTLPSILLCFYRAAVHEDVMTWKRFLYYWLFVREIRLGPTIYLWFVAFTNIVLFINHIWYIYIHI